MKIAHIADPHLGYRAYNRITSQGLNRREADVFQAFRQALAKVVEIGPDVILIAGDMFHVVRPSNLTIQQTFREFIELRTKTNAPIVIIGGNHDSPRQSDTGCILDLFANLPGIYVVHGRDFVQIKLPDLKTSVFCLSHRTIAYLHSLKIKPDASSKHNILLVHGTVEGIIRNAYDLDVIPRNLIINDDWDYVALGHYHVFSELAPNAFYAGATEYTSHSIWSETKQPKGLIEYDLDNRKLIDFHKVATRDVIDLRPIDAKEFTANELNTAIQRRIETVEGGHENKIVRLVVENLYRSVQADLDFSLIRQVRSEALHFELQLRPPTRDGRTLTSSSDSGVAKPLEEEWDDFAKVYDIPAGVDRERFIDLGRDYLAKMAQSE